MKQKERNVDYLQILENKTVFSRNELYDAMKQFGIEMGEASFKVYLQKLLNDGRIVRVGRNTYCVADTAKIYDYEYSDLAGHVASLIDENYPYLNFSIMELTQLNEFVNHQLAHNVFFVSVEANLGEFVFETLKGEYPGKVLIHPTPQIYHQYWYDNMIVIQKRVSEAPVSKKVRWHTRIEKLLVDLLTDDILQSSVSESEYQDIYEDAFTKYAVDESCMFRYAKRRGADIRIKKFIADKTKVNLRLG